MRERESTKATVRKKKQHPYKYFSAQERKNRKSSTSDRFIRLEAAKTWFIKKECFTSQVTQRK